MWRNEMAKRILMVLCLVLIYSNNSMAQTALGSEFTYQGELEFNNTVAEGVFDFKFVLFDAQDDGSGANLGNLTVEDVQVTQGVFTTQLDFGSSVFVGDKIWMEINVRQGALTGGFQQLLPRQEITSTPYAIHAQFVGADAVTGIEIQNGSIMNVDLASNSISSNNIITNAVGSNEIAANAVGAVELADSAVDTGAIQDDAVTSAKIASGSVGSSEIISSQVQRRVSQTSDNGFYLRGINEDGSTICQQLPFGIHTTVDSNDNTGFFTDIAINPVTDLAIISYFEVDQVNQVGSLNTLACANVSCTTGTIQILESNLMVFTGFNLFERQTSIVVRSNGMPIVAYYDPSTLDLKIYDCSSNNCSTGTVRILDSIGDVGQYASIAIRSNDLPIISYYDATSVGNLKLYDCSTTTCSSGNIRQLTTDADNNAGQYTSIAIGVNDLARISFYHADLNRLDVYNCANTSCTSGGYLGLTDALQGNQGKYSSIQFHPNGNSFFISFFDDRSNNAEIDRMKVIFCNNLSCDNKVESLTDEASHPTGQYTSMAMRPNGLPIISYYDQADQDLKVYDCTNNVCSSGIVRTLDDLGAQGLFTSIAIGNDGLPIISYYDFQVGHLKVYKCGDSRCKY